MENVAPTRLPVVFCLLVDFPDDTIDCYKPTQSESAKDVCFTCPLLGRFLTGDTLEDHGSAGHAISQILWVCIMIVGCFGIATNCLIINIMRKQNDTRAFDFLLIVLASFDLLSSATSVIASTAMITYFENWSRGPATLYFYYLPFLFCLLGRSGSSYMTVLITVERYLVIAYPTKSYGWFTHKRIRLMAAGVVALAVLINIPRITSLTVDYNYTGQEVSSLRNLEYIIRSTSLERFWYHSLKSVHYLIDIWVPFPILIVFNVLLYIEIKKFTSRRQELSKKLITDIRAARMFVPVVIVLFICNIEPISHYAVLHFTGMYYRELVLGLTLSIALNSAANLPIYYARGSSFRQEIRAALPKWCTFCLSDQAENEEPISLTMTTG